MRGGGGGGGIVSRSDHLNLESINSYEPKKIQVGFFLGGTRPCANPLGELTRPTAVGGAPIEVRTSLPGEECQPTQLTRRAPPGDPPGGDRLTHWQMSLLTMQQRPEVSTRIDTGR